jgi:hypothetical protein
MLCRQGWVCCSEVGYGLLPPPFQVLADRALDLPGAQDAVRLIEGVELGQVRCADAQSYRLGLRLDLFGGLLCRGDGFGYHARSVRQLLP